MILVVRITKVRIYFFCSCRYLDAIFDGTLPRSILDIRHLINENRGSLEPLLAMMNRWERFCREWCDHSAQAADLFRTLLSPLNSQFERDLVVSFFRSPETYMGETGVARSAFRTELQIVEDNIAWMERIGDKVFSYLSSM